MSDRMDYPARYGLDHPTWARPECFFYDSLEAALEAIEETYGLNSGHIVVRLDRVSDDLPTAHRREDEK